jgi:X-Pro dipeptidyl-peptidase
VVTEEYYVPTVGGATIYVEVTRDTDFERVPIILTYSPYNNLGEPNPSQDGYASRYVPRGYARAVADVLGTRGSTGCWDYGGPAEQQSGIDVVKFLAHQPWANGKVAMIGGSYEGTTATMVAARGPEVPELKAIVPIAAISHWYGYAYNHGVRFFLNSQSASDEGFDTPLLFDYGFGRTVAPDPTNETFGPTITSRVGPCEAEALEHTTEGYSRQPDYDGFWQERSYRKDAANFRAAVLLAHGWQDYNVKQEEAIELWEALRVDPRAVEHKRTGVPFKIMYLTQGTHGGATSGPEWQPLLDAFLAHTLLGERNGVNKPSVRVLTRGRTVTDAGAYQTLAPSPEADWPPSGTEETVLHINRKFDYDVPGMPEVPPGTGETGTLDPQANPDARFPFFTYFDTGTSTEEISLRDPLNHPGHGYYSLFYESAPLATAQRLAGSAILDVDVRYQTAGQHLTPLLVDVLPNGDLRLVERGFLNLDYAAGLEKANPRPGQWVGAQVEFLPQDFTFPAGHRIGLIIQSSNTVWAVPGGAGQVNIAHGQVANTTTEPGRLVLPLVSPGSPLFA